MGGTGDGAVGGGPVDSGPDLVTLVERLPEMVVVIGPDLTITYVNERLCEVMGHRREDVVGTNVFDFSHPDDHEYMATTWALRAAAPGEIGMFIQVRGRNADGSWRALEILGLSLLDDPAIGGMVMTLRDLTMKVDRGDTSARFRSMLDRTSDVVLVVDPDGRIAYANRRLTSTHGVDHDAIVGTAFAALVADGDHPGLDRWFQQLVDGGGQTQSRIRLRAVDRDGTATARTLEWHGTNQLDDPIIAGVILSGRDVSELVEMERRLQVQTDELRHSATHDALTGLLDRGAFVDQVRARLAARRTAGDEGDAVVLFCDLDRFKHVNDTHGHAMGDRVLEVAAGRLRGQLRDGDVLARWGGDEFTVLLEDGPDEAAVTALVERIRLRLGTPITHEGTTAVVGASVGTSRAAVATADVEALLHSADEQMYARKAARRS